MIAAGKGGKGGNRLDTNSEPRSLSNPEPNGSRDRKPITIQSDKCTEFVNARVQQFLKGQGVNFHTTHNPDIKGAVTVCFNTSLKTRMFKYFSKKKT